MLYREEWSVHRKAIMTKNGWDRCPGEIMISTPRRFGKTFAYAPLTRSYALPVKVGVGGGCGGPLFFFCRLGQTGRFGGAMRFLCSAVFDCSREERPLFHRVLVGGRSGMGACVCLAPVLPLSTPSTHSTPSS